jgi:hypothetical protein
MSETATSRFGAARTASVDRFGEQPADVLVARFLVRPKENQLLDTAHAGHQIDSKQIASPNTGVL